jgi:RNA polymerase sigma factor (sigma-70 family)
VTCPPDRSCAIEPILVACRPRITAVARRWMRGCPAAEIDDLVQDALLVAWARRHTWRGDGPFPAFVTAIAVRLCHRARARRREVPCDHDSADPAISALDRYLFRERLLAVTDALSRLPDDDRRVVALRWVEDTPRDEIARIMGIEGANAVRVILQRAKRLMRAQLVDDDRAIAAT